MAGALVQGAGMFLDLSSVFASVRRRQHGRNSKGPVGTSPDVVRHSLTLADHVRLRQATCCEPYPSGKIYCPVRVSPGIARRYAPSGQNAEAPLIEPAPDDLLSESFMARDFYPPAGLGFHCRFLRIKADVVELAQDIAEALRGHKLQILNAFLLPVQARLLGVPISPVHQDGLAIDICCEDVPLQVLYEIADRIVAQRGAVILYEGRFLHIDVAVFGHRRIVKFSHD